MVTFSLFRFSNGKIERLLITDPSDFVLNILLMQRWEVPSFEETQLLYSIGNFVEYRLE